MAGLIPWRRSSGSMLEQMQREMDDVFRRFFGESALAESETNGLGWAPQVDIEETDKEMVVKADLPGVDPKDIEISLSENTLTLRGEKKEEKEEKDKNYHRVERFAGQFYRRIPLPAQADPEKIEASTANGVVTVTVPKKAEAQAKKITVKPQG